MAEAREYGKALLMLANEAGNAEAVLTELSEVKQAVKENPKYIDLADTPALPSKTRVGLIHKAFNGVNDNLLNLLMLLCEKREFYKISAITDCFRTLYDESVGRIRVTAVTAVPLLTSQADKLRNKLEEKTGKEVVVENIIDPAVLGGMNLRYEGVQLDGTLRANLLSVEKTLAELKL